MKEITLIQMKYFVAVVEQGTLKRAANACYVTQPAITLQMQNLEKAVGVCLLDKSGRKSELTVHGKVFYAKAQRVLETISDIGPILDELTKKLNCIEGSTV